jgi:hypothetical protein
MSLLPPRAVAFEIFNRKKAFPERDMSCRRHAKDAKYNHMRWEFWGYANPKWIPPPGQLGGPAQAGRQPSFFPQGRQEEASCPRETKR